MTITEQAARTHLSASAAARLVCMYCAGHAPMYEARVAGPNTAGNYIHKAGESVQLCRASSIFAWVRFQQVASR